MAERPYPLLDPRQKRRPDIATLCNELAGISDWRKLGLYLGVQDHELDQIESTHPTEGCGRWKQETFSLWLKHTPNASWRDVVGALRQMGENTEAERIEQKYTVGPVPASPLSPPISVGGHAIGALQQMGENTEAERIERKYTVGRAKRRREPKLDNKDQQGGAEQSKVNGKPSYLVQLYQNIGDYPTDNIAAVTVSLHQPVYAMNFKKCLEEWYPSFHFVPSGKVVHFSSHKATVKFPTDVQGWSIVSDIQPCEIHRVEVDLPILSPHLDYSKALIYPPKRLLTISPPPAEMGLSYSTDCPLLISGFSEKVEFTLKLRPRPYMPSMMEELGVAGGKRMQLEGKTERTPSRSQLKDLVDALHHKVAVKWRMFGMLLSIPDAELEVIAKIHRGDLHMCLVEVLETWLKQVYPPPTWTAIIEAVQFLGEEQLGKELREKYLHVEESPMELGVAGGKRMRLEGTGSDKAEVKDQKVQTEAVEIKNQHVQADTTDLEQVINKVEIKHHSVQTETVEIKYQHVQTDTIAQEQAHIRGVEVIAKETFTITQEAVKLNFEGYGFKLCVPKNSLPAEVSETQLSVRVSLSGPFQMPFNCELASAVYWVSSPHKFVKCITVEIQHCAALSSGKQCSQLTFVHTKCTQKELPYIFKEKVGGVFTSHSSYGSLSLSHFSGIGIVISPPPQRSFRVEPVQPVLPASRQAINSDLGHRQQLPHSSGQAFDSQQQQQQQLPKSSRQAINSELGQRQQLPQSSGQAFDSQQQRQQQLPQSSGQTFDSQQQQQQQLPKSSGQAFDSDLGQQPQQQSLTESEALCQTQQEEEGGVLQYCAQLYITCKLVTEWKVDFVVTKDLESCLTVVQKKYISHGQPQFSFNFRFKEDFVSLKIPEKGKLGGWEITPFYDPKIARQQVNHFSSGKSIPKCQLLLQWSKKPPPACLKCKIGLIGACDHKYFLLHINPDAEIPTTSDSGTGSPSSTTAGPTSSQRGSQLPNPELKDLTHLHISNWHKLGLALGLKPYKLDIIKKNHQGDTESQTCNMFEVWLKTQPEASYKQLIKALCEVGDETVAHSLCKKYAKCSLESFSKDDSKECTPSPSPEQPMECLSSSSSSQYFPSSGSHKRRHVPRGRQSRLRSRSPRHSSSTKHQSHSPRSHRELYSRSPLHSRSPTSRSTSHSRSSKRRTESRSHKQRSKLSSSRRSRSQSPPRRRSRSHSPSSNGHQSRPHSPRSRRHRRQSHSGSPRRRSHSRSPTSRSTFHSHSSQRRRSKSRSLSPHKQRVKSHSTRRRSRSQSPSRKRLSSRSPRHCSSSRHQSRPQSPKSHRRDRSQSHSWSPRQRSHSRSSTSRSKFRSHRSKRRRSMSRSRSPPRKKLSMRSHSPGYSSSSRYRSRSHSPRSRRRPHFWSPHRRSRSRSRTSRNSSRSQRPKRRSKPRSQSPHNH